MKFNVDKKIFERFPSYLVGVVVATGIDNTKKQDETFALLQKTITATQKALKNTPATKIPHVRAWRDAFEKEGIDVSKFFPSTEALLLRVIQRQEIPNINPIVNILNVLSIKHQISIGGHDLAGVNGNLHVEDVKPGMTFQPMGSKENEKVEKEIVYSDDREVLTRRWVWRQGEKTKTNLNTKDIFIPIDALPPQDENSLKQIMEDVANLISRTLGGKTAIFLVKRENPIITLPILSQRKVSARMDAVDEVLTRGVENIYPTKQALEKVLQSGKKIRLYQGFDPSMPNLHLGHMVGVLKLRQFQELGHEVIFLVGDFTGMIGDPTDKTAARKLLTREQIRQNCRAWKKQAGKILNFGGKNPAKFMFNSTWLDKINFKDLIGLTSKFTVQQMIERDFFQKRIKEGRPIFLHEFLYPVAQAIDSLKMDVDLEIGGSDQTFNMLCGRTLMAAVAKKEKFVLTTKLLVDVKGEKVGKTAGNALFLNATPRDMYGGIMSFPDEVLSLAFELLTQLPLRLIKVLTEKLSPMDLKKRLAFEIVKMHCSEKRAKKAQSEFERVFQERKTPDQLPVYKTAKKSFTLPDLLLETSLVSSKSEAKRLVQQKAVEIDNQLVNEPQSIIKIKNGMVIRVGKRRFIKILLS